MAETVATKPAFAKRRCLVPIETFYEWKKLAPEEKQPYAIALARGGFMALAGLSENWKSPAGEWVRSFTIVTKPPSSGRREYRRHPVVDLAAQLVRRAEGRWRRYPQGADRAALSSRMDNHMVREPARRQRRE